MTYPPEGCRYEVFFYTPGGAFTSDTFTDEYALGEWFIRQEDAGALDRELECQDRPGGFRIDAVTETDRVPIDLGHYRLVQGRLRMGGRARR